MSSPIETNRNVRIRGNVRVDHTATFHGSVILPGAIAWPDSPGSAGQMLGLDGSESRLQWVSLNSTNAPEHTRIIVTAPRHSASPDHHVILVDRYGSTTVTLPAVSTAPNVLYRIADIAGQLTDEVTITIAARHGDTIIGEPTFVLSRPYNSITLGHDGVSKWVLF